MLERYAIHDARIFFGFAGAVLAYLLYMMIRKRRGERPGDTDQDSDL
jgi:hypothetical protein